MKRCKILIPTSCRSDDPLTKPMIELIKKDEFFRVVRMELEPANFVESYERIKHMIDYTNPYCILIMGDRIETTAAACASFHKNIPIIHYGSGVTNSITTYDDINRHYISMIADVCLCENFKTGFIVNNLLESIGKFESGMSYDVKTFNERNIHIVGNLYLDTINEIDESLVPDEPYDLILLNPETINNRALFYYNGGIRKQISIGSNPDLKAEIEVDYKNLPRSQFLGLLKNCSRFITNSSSAYYEAMPLGLKREQIVLVGNRNKNRSTPMEWKQDFKTSERIIEIIKEWWKNKNLKNKKEELK